jgi:ABC-2 type transport system permease protein
MTALGTTGEAPVFEPIDPTGAHVSPVTVFVALLRRDVVVLGHRMGEFLPRTVLQPLLLVFVFTRVFPEIGQGFSGGGAGAAAGGFSTMLVPGVIGSVILFQGIQAVALPLVQEFGYTKEIEDRVLAPLPVEWVAIGKVVSGALQCLLAAVIVFPIARFVPATTVDLTINWPVLVTFLPLACLASASLGLTFGTAFDPRTVPLLFGVVIVPLTFLGCIYFTWQSLERIRWLQILVLGNPLVYISEGLRAALTPVAAMPLVAVYGVMLAFTAFFLWRGITGFRRRVLS